MSADDGPQGNPTLKLPPAASTSPDPVDQHLAQVSIAPENSDSLPRLTPEFETRYRLVRSLGTGALGTVYEAVQLSTLRPVAIKFLSRTDDLDSVARFLAEGKLTARVSHPNVVKVYDFGSVDGHPYLVNEYVGGGTLAHLLERRKRLELAEAVDLIVRCLAGLDACHEAGITHRDLKPANILLADDGTPKIADLGLARCRESTRLTATGMLLGTPMYMSPEQTRGEPVGAPSDIYSMALIFYEAVAGRLPFPASTLEDVLSQRRTAVPLPLTVHAGVPEAVSRLVESALDRDPSRRPATARELALALGQAASSSASQSPSVRMSTTGGATPPRAIPVWRYLTLLTVIGLGLSAWLAAYGPGALHVPSPDPTTSVQGPSRPADTLEEEVRRLRDQEEARVFDLRRFCPDDPASGDRCPLVVTCPEHIERVEVMPGPGTIVSHPVLGLVRERRSFSFKGSGLKVGLNWLALAAPGGRPAARVRFHRGPCPAPVGTDRLPRGIDLYRRTDELLCSSHLTLEEPKARSLLASAIASVPRAMGEAAVARLVLGRGEPLVYALEQVSQATDDAVERDPRLLERTRRLVEIFGWAVEDDPARWDPWRDLADALHRVGQDEASRTAEVQALAIWPRSEHSWTGLGLIERRAFQDLRRRQTDPELRDTARKEAGRFFMHAHSCGQELGFSRSGRIHLDTNLREMGVASRRR